MKSARRDLTLKLEDHLPEMTFGVEIEDDTDRFTNGGRSPLGHLALPITIRWPLVILKFNNPRDARSAFMTFGQFSKINPKLIEVIHALMDEVGIPALTSY